MHMLHVMCTCCMLNNFNMADLHTKTSKNSYLSKQTIVDKSVNQIELEDIKRKTKWYVHFVV